MLDWRIGLGAVVFLVACERGPQGYDETVLSESLAESQSGRVGVIIGTARVNKDGTAGDSVEFEGFFARHHGIGSMATIDALGARPVADVLGHRPGECWREERHAPDRGAIQLLEVGGLSVQGTTRAPLEGKAVPALLDKISGTLYRTSQGVLFGANREVRVQSTGGATVGAFDVTLKIPGALELGVFQRERSTGGRDLIVFWKTDGVVGDAVVISVREGDSTLRCVAADQGSFHVRAALLGSATGTLTRIVATRVRLSSFSARGLQSAHAGILVEEELSLRRGE